MKIAKIVTLQGFVYLAGFSSFIFFLFLAMFWRNLCDFITISQFQLNPDSTLFRMWNKNPVPIYFEIYIFNFTNAEEFERNKTTVPNFAEVGPFYFEEAREKVDISWDDSQETVIFNQTRKWRFLPEASQSLSVNITNINPVAATMAYISRLWPSKLQRVIINALLNAHEPLLVKASAQEWLFDGIPDKFLDLFESLRKVTEISIPYNRFGWFYKRNDSSSFDGVLTIKTGKSNVYDVGMMVAWNHKNKTEHYADECALVHGSTGEIFPPLKPFQKSISVFATDICSYIALKYAKSDSFDGIDTYVYVGDESVFDNGTYNPENQCFYQGESVPSGLRNVSTCRFGSPAFISFPHFYLADSYYTEKLTGMSPDESKHKFTLKVEPKTGVPLYVEAAFQINFLVQAYEWCDQFRELPKMYIPMLWFKQTVKISETHSSALKVLLFMKSNGGILLFCYSYFILFCLLMYFLWTKNIRRSSL